MATSTWQMNLRSQTARENGAGMVQGKQIGGLKGRGGRNALGDISNRVSNNGMGVNNNKLGKKASSKPSFNIQIDEEECKQKQQVVQQQQQCHQEPMMTRNYQEPYIPENEVDRCDVGDLQNVKYAAEYVGDIYNHYRNVELKYHPSANYMSKQTQINEKMRGLLIDWLIQVHIKFELLPQTLYLTVNVLDRFLELKIVPRRKLQLVGCAAMLLASKYEEIYSPEANDFVSMSDRAFTAEELLRMEGVMLNTLNFNMTTPSPYTFLRRFMKVAGSSAKIQHFATYLIERSLQEYSMLKFRPSLLAASALNLAQRSADEELGWTQTLIRHSGYNEQHMEECVDTMKYLYNSNLKSQLHAVSKKYSSSKYMHVSMIELL